MTDRAAYIIHQRVGRRIKTFRRQRKMSRAELATRLSYSLDTIRDKETGAVGLDIAFLVRVADALDVTVADLIEGI